MVGTSDLLFTQVVGNDTYLYSTDGTHTTQLFDLSTESSPSPLQDYDVSEIPAAVVGSTAYLVLSDSTQATTAIWSYNGTTASQITSSSNVIYDSEYASSSTNPQPLAAFGSDLVFSQATSSAGEANATLAIYNPSNGEITQPTTPHGGFDPHSFVTLNGTLYFEATDSSTNYQAIYAYNGNDVTELYNLHPVITGNFGAGPETIPTAGNVNGDIIAFNGNIYFGTSGNEVYELNTATVNSATEITSQSNSGYDYSSSGPENFIIYSSKLYFYSNQGGANEYGGIYSISTSNAVSVVDTHLYATFNQPAVLNGNLYYFGENSTPNESIYEITTSTGPSVVTAGIGTDATVFNGKIYFHDEGSSATSGLAGYTGSGSVSDVSLAGTQGDPTIVVPFAASSFSIEGGSSNDSTPPTVQGIALETSPSVNHASSEVFQVTFSESVTGVASNDFTAATTGTVSETSISVGGSGSVYTVTVEGVTGNGTLGLNVNASSGVTDSNGNQLATGYNDGPTYTVQHTPPSISAVSVSGASSLDAAHAGDHLSFHATFSEAVTVSGTPELSLSNGQDATYVSGSGTNDLLFSYTVEGGQYSNDLHVNDLVLNGGSINDAAGNAANDSASFDTGVSVDANHPALSVTASSAYALQGGSAIAVLSGAPTITDTDGSGSYDHVTVSIVGGQSGDSLSVLGAANGSVIIDDHTFLVGGSGSDELTISSGNTAANYEAVLNDVLFTAGANDTVTGSHPSVTIEFSVTNSTNDGLLTSAPSNATIDIDRAPGVSDQTVAAVTGATVSVAAANGALHGDTDADGDSLSIASVAGASSPVAISSGDLTVSGSYGDLVIGSDGHYSYAAGANETETSALSSAATGSHPIDAFTLSVSDGHGGTTSETLNFDIDRAPSVSDQTIDAAAGATVSMAAASGVLNGDTDPDGDSLSIASVTGASSPVAISSGDVTVGGSYGELTIGADGHYSYTAGATNDEVSALSSAATGSHPIDSFLLTVSDGHGGTTSETLDVSLDRAPGALTNVATVTSAVNEEAAAGATVGVTAHAVDPDGDTITYVISNDSSDGGFSINASTGVVSVADPSDIDYATSGPNHDYTITVQASDGTLSSSQSFTIGVNDVAPTILGASADQTTTDKLAISPFAAVTISGASSTQEETVHVTIGNTANGGFTAASLTNSGFVADTVVAGQYDFTGTVANDTTAIEQLVFDPTQNQVTPGQTVTTDFTIYAGDGDVGANDTTTSVVVTSVNDPPTITGTVAGQTIIDNQTIKPFAHVTIGDPDVGQTETVTITPNYLGNGTFSNLGGGGLNAAGDYTVAGSTAAVTAALDGLVFVPTAHLAGANVPVDTTFTIAVSDGDTLVSNSATTLTVVSTAAPTTDHATNGSDVLTADPGGDTVLGMSGDDTISGGTGHDQLYGNTGNDVILLLTYTDSSTVYGGQGDDVLDARRSSASNFLSGDLGNDSILGGAGNDTIYGGDGDDTVVGGSGHDQLYGNTGNDHIVLGSTNMGSTVYGGQGDDVVDASASTHANYISGDLGNDVILAGSGGDTIYGGEGSDTIQAASAAPTYIHVGATDSSAVSATDVSQLDHVTHFNSQTQLIFDGDPSATSANTVFHGGDPAIANYAAAYAYAYGTSGHAGVVTGSTEYAVVSDAAGHVYIFAQDHAAVELDGLSGGVSSVALGQILSA